MKLYICSSLYHIFITLVKTSLSKEQVDLVIGTQVPNYQTVIERIKRRSDIRKIYLYDSESYKEMTYRNKIDRILHAKSREIEYIDRELPINWNEYVGEIYTYNDFEILGWYLVDRKIPFHLIEDGLNFFTYFHQYYNLPRAAYDPSHWKMKLKNLLEFNHRGFGASQYVQDIEVNSRDDLVIPAQKVVVVPRTELYRELSEEDKQRLYKVFCQQPLQKGIKQKKTMLLCTQPFYYDGQLSSLELQKQVFADIVCDYSDRGYAITIKPHPRDDVDYQDVCEKYNAWMIDRYIPSEVLNFDSNISFDLALSVTTTAIETLQFVKERKYLGFEYLVKYKNERIGY